MLAINFNIYEKLLKCLTNFFDDWKNNFKFLLIFSLGAISSIVLCSKLILYLLTNYKYITLMFFLGLIIGGTYNFSKNIKFNLKNICILIIIVLPFLYISLSSFNNSYIIKNNFSDKIIFFIGGIIEIFASIVPGISGTSLLMMIGIYDYILEMVAMLPNINYVINNLSNYLSYGLGMAISFIINMYLISFLLKKYRYQSYVAILGLSLSSILFLIITILKIKTTLLELIIGIMLLVIGLLSGYLLDK